MNKIISYFSWLAKYYLGFIFAFELLILKDRLNRKNKTYILLYHRITDDDDAKKISYPLDAGLISKKEFEWQMRYLSKKYQIVSLKNLVLSLKNKKKLSSVSIAITFDDGYKDNYLNAYPILKKYNIPATIFLVSDYIGTNKIFWWDKVTYVLRYNKLAKKRIKKDFLIHKILVDLRKLDEIKREKIIEDLVNKSNISLAKIQKSNPVLSWDEIKKMNECRLIDFASHTKTHPLLTKLENYQLKEEIYNSKLEIEKRLGKKIYFFAYPYSEANQSIKTAAKKAGYLAAFFADINQEDKLNKLFSLKRIVPLEGLTWIKKII